MKYLPYVLKHLTRNWIRTASTLAGLALCIFLICVLQTVLEAIRNTTEAADPSRVVTRHAVSLTFNMPLSYKPRIQAIPGVEQVAISNWFIRRRAQAVILAGGVALNCVANSRLQREGPFERVWVQPAAGDAGTALGGALHVAQALGLYFCRRTFRCALAEPRTMFGSRRCGGARSGHFRSRRCGRCADCARCSTAWGRSRSCAAPATPRSASTLRCHRSSTARAGPRCR